MTRLWLATLASAPGVAVGLSSNSADPISKVLQLLGDLQAKIIKEGEVAQKEYSEYAEWCENQHADLSYEIKTGDSQVAALTATIQKESSNIEAFSAKIEQIAAGSAAAEADLAAAKKVRNEEAAGFAAEEKELVDILDTLGRAIRVIEKEMRNGGAAMMQLQRMPNLLRAFGTMVQAAMISSADAGRLTAFVQDAHKASSDGDDEDSGAPAAAVYDSHSGNIVDTLENLLEKAEEQLSSLRKTEQSAQHNFDMLRQSLEDEISFATKDLATTKKGLAASEEGKSVAEGDLEVTSTDLKSDRKELDDVHHQCQVTAGDFSSATRSRGEELDSLAAAKKAISETTGGAGAITYGLNQVSFLQAQMESDHFAVVRFVRRLARKEGSTQLAQLASRMAATIKFNTHSGQDPFAKVKDLISGLITRLESSAQTDASQKAYCDKETADTKENKDDKSAEVEKLTTVIDQASSRVAVLEKEIGDLTTELANVAKARADFDKFYMENEATFTANKAEMEKGIDGVQMAVKVLNEYYAKDGKDHSAADGAAGSIVGMLEVVESDFTKGLAEASAGFANVKRDYEDFCRESDLVTATKGQDVKYKGAEVKKLKKSLADTTNDRKTAQSELEAIGDYMTKINEMCVAKAEPYEERARRREAELAGLKEALQVLEGEAVLLQKSSAQQPLRDVRRH